ncbi:uncharacterized protein LOC105663836 [Megachile rotundata]|uniref:uncharacterized protein LOC105663836 n=1 Tax=Megachile rotundata TaxID=143995 RepID=UPI003FD42EB5
MEDDGNHYPLAVPVLQNQIYVDDCVFGADDVDLARQTRKQLISLLNRAVFTLRKWASNTPALLSNINPNDHSVTSTKTLQPNKPLQPELKVLGVSWNPNVDSFQFNIIIGENVPQTKRTILSTIAKFFDPLGWVTPVVIKGKILMQHLWHFKCDWDVNIPNAILDEWISYYKQLPCLRQLSLPRWVNYGSYVKSYELHGFADASSSAYAAVVYLKTITLSGDVTISLLTAKSKVALLKSISIPRLELCAAVLLSRLLVFVKSTLALQSVTSYCWTDSTIVLAWVCQLPSRWKTFVANRVAEIQTNIPNVKWHHVTTDDNPADCSFRGLNCEQLGFQSIW